MLAADIKLALCLLFICMHRKENIEMGIKHVWRVPIQGITLVEAHNFPSVYMIKAYIVMGSNFGEAVVQIKQRS